MWPSTVSPIFWGVLCFVLKFSNKCLKLFAYFNKANIHCPESYWCSWGARVTLGYVIYYTTNRTTDLITPWVFMLHCCMTLHSVDNVYTDFPTCSILPPIVIPFTLYSRAQLRELWPLSVKYWLARKFSGDWKRKPLITIMYESLPRRFFFFCYLNSLRYLNGLSSFY